MLINKYIKNVKAIDEASKTELLSYKLVLSSQIIDNEKSIDLIDAQINKIELREPNDIKGGLWK